MSCASTLVQQSEWNFLLYACWKERWQLARHRTGYINLNATRECVDTPSILVEKRRAIDGTGREMKLYGQLSAVFREN